MKWYGGHPHAAEPMGSANRYGTRPALVSRAAGWATMASVPARVNGSPRERAGEPFEVVPSPPRTYAERDGLLGAFARLFGD